jgi:hypothetical protein
VNCAAGRADDIDGLGDLAPVGFAELAEVVFGPPDELPQPRDLLVGRRGLAPGPVIEVLGGPDAFAGLQQAVEVVAKLWQVGKDRSGSGRSPGSGTGTGRLRRRP